MGERAFSGYAALLPAPRYMPACHASWRAPDENSDKETLVVRFGGDALMPDVRHLITQCRRKDAPSAACGVYYADLRLPR
jgi:hypothetical protein